MKPIDIESITLKQTGKIYDNLISEMLWHQIYDNLVIAVGDRMMEELIDILDHQLEPNPS